MVNVKKYTESNYLSAKNAAEFKDKNFIIDAAFEEEVGQNKDTKICIRLQKIEKPIVLNKTNISALSLAFGEDTVDWVNRKVTFRIYPTSYNGQPTQGILLEPLK